jgi:hypothetical protein
LAPFQKISNTGKTERNGNTCGRRSRNAPGGFSGARARLEKQEICVKFLRTHGVQPVTPGESEDVERMKAETRGA